MTVKSMSPGREQRSRGRATLYGLSAQVAEMHGCLDHVGGRMDALAERALGDRQEGVARDLAIEHRLDRLEASVDLLVKFFGLRAPRQPGRAARRRLTLGGLEWWQAVLSIAGSVLAALGAWKYLWPGVLAVHHALLAAR